MDHLEIHPISATEIFEARRLSVCPSVRFVRPFRLSVVRFLVPQSYLQQSKGTAEAVSSI